jgi:hypothetical protein
MGDVDGERTFRPRAQLSVTGKGQCLRYVLPAIVSRSLLATRGEAGPDAPVFRSRKGGALMKRAAERAGGTPAVSVRTNPFDAASA